MDENYEEEQLQGILTENVVTHLSMCSGYEGMGRGLRGIFPNLREIAYVEREGYCCANLVAKIEEGELSEAPIFTDVKEFPYGKFRGCVDILSAGFPCQPFSSSGVRKGTEDPRHLFPFIADGVRLCQPNWVALENVEGIISCKFGGEPDTSVLKYVMARMEEIGYEGAFTLVSASEEGAPHQRKRVFMLFRNADPDTEIERGLGDTERTGLPSLLDGQGEKQPWRAGTWPSRPGEAQYEWEEPRVIMAYPEDGQDGRNARVGKEQAVKEPVSNSPDRGGYNTIEGCIRQSMENPYCGGSKESMQLDSSVPSESSGGSTQEGKELGNPKHDGCTSTEECRGTSSQQEEGRVQESEGGCSEPRDEPRDNVSYTEDGGCRGGSSSERECGERQVREDKCQGGEVLSEAEGCSGDNGSVGNSASIGSCGGSEDINGLESEVPRQGYGSSVTMGDTSSVRSCEESSIGGEQQPSVHSEESRTPEHPRETESFVGGIPDGATKEYHVTPEVMALRVPRLRLLGNGIVPAQAERAYRILFAHFIK